MVNLKWHLPYLANCKSQALYWAQEHDGGQQAGACHVAISVVQGSSSSTATWAESWGVPQSQMIRWSLHGVKPVFPSCFALAKNTKDQGQVWTCLVYLCSIHVSCVLTVSYPLGGSCNQYLAEKSVCTGHLFGACLKPCSTETSSMISIDQGHDTVLPHHLGTSSAPHGLNSEVACAKGQEIQLWKWPHEHKKSSWVDDWTPALYAYAWPCWLPKWPQISKFGIASLCTYIFHHISFSTILKHQMTVNHPLRHHQRAINSPFSAAFLGGCDRCKPRGNPCLSRLKCTSGTQVWWAAAQQALRNEIFTEYDRREGQLIYGELGQY